jgi:hypothetical protein
MKLCAAPSRTKRSRIKEWMRMTELPPDPANSRLRCTVIFTSRDFRNSPLQPDQDRHGSPSLHKRNPRSATFSRHIGRPPMPPPVGHPHQRKTRPPSTTPRASAPAVLVMWSKAQRSSRDATSRQQGADRDGRIAGPKGSQIQCTTATSCPSRLQRCP